jgi:hypothetical protein
MKKSKEEKEAKKAKQLGEGLQLAEDLNGGGSALIGAIEESLTDRLRALMGTDPECKALTKLLANINCKLASAEKLAVEAMGEAHKYVEK